MLTYFSSNVILSKARAMYGKRLKTKDYIELLNCRTVSEVASFLKSKVRYKQILSSVNETDVHRGRLEELLKQKLFYDCASLCKYELSIGQHFAEYFIENFEIEQLMHSLMLLKSGRIEEYIYSMPVFFNKHTKIDLLALAKVKSYDEFLDAISKTRYRKILELFKVEENFKIDLPLIENVLYSDLYKRLFNVIEKYSGGSEKKELLDMVNSYVDMKNFVRILRLKKYYKSDEDCIRRLLLDFGTLKQKNINQMIEAVSIDEIVEIMKSTRPGKKMGEINFSYIDELYEKVRFEKSRKNIRFSINASVVMFSYVFLLETEITNIVNIIEGVRYHVPSEEIDKMLVYRKE